MRHRTNPAPAPAKGRGGIALATYSRVGSAYLITAVDDDAADLGIAPGMTLADARALRPGLRIEEADPAADTKLLASLADFCERWTPCVALDPPDGLFLEIAGSAHLFGGEAALREEISKRIAALGFGCRVAVADTSAAAWALAHYGAHLIAARGETAEVLKSLPAAALRLEAAGAALLKRLGIITIGQLIERPRAPFAARIGEGAQRRLDEALGRIDPAIKFHRALPPISAMRQCLEPLTDADSLFIAISDAAKDIACEAMERCLSMRKLAVTLFSPTRETHRLSAGYSAGERDAEALARPFLELLRSASSSIDFEFGIEILRLDAVETVPFTAQAENNTARLIDILSARLGEEAVLRLACADRHIPEHAESKTPALETSRGIFNSSAADKSFVPLPPGGVRGGITTSSDKSPSSPPPKGEGHNKSARPLKLFASPSPIEVMAAIPDGPPLRFRWRRVLHDVARAQGPERIAAEWWLNADSPTRDYFEIEDTRGGRYWVYREGLYGRETNEPRWFVHGLFG